MTIEIFYLVKFYQSFGNADNDSLDRQMMTNFGVYYRLISHAFIHLQIFFAWWKIFILFVKAKVFPDIGLSFCPGVVVYLSGIHIEKKALSIDKTRAASCSPAYKTRYRTVERRFAPLLHFMPMIDCEKVQSIIGIGSFQHAANRYHPIISTPLIETYLRRLRFSLLGIK